MSKKTYLDVYSHCYNCPVEEHCGTVVGSIRLCNSYKDNKDSKDEK